MITPFNSVALKFDNFYNTITISSNYLSEGKGKVKYSLRLKLLG